MTTLFPPILRRLCFIAALLPLQMSFGETDGDGWTDFVPVVSNGTRNNTDPGSRIFYIDAATGNNSTGQYYWWNGSQVIDNSGNTYGSDPMNPTGAIKPFASHQQSRFRGNPLYNQTHYPDWGLFKRGQNHAFSGTPQAGRSPEEPALLGAYGDLNLSRPHLMGQISICNCGDAEVTNLVVLSLQLGTPSVASVSILADVPGPQWFPGDRNDSRSWFWFEDVLIDNTPSGFTFLGVLDATVYRSVIKNIWSASEHNQGIYQDGSETNLTVIDTIFYRNGMKSNPLTDSTPSRDVFSRNLYIGGGEHMGTRLVNIISADGGSGGPQVRYGGIVENSLIIEGYWFTSTDSNGTVPTWLETGMETYAFRNNVQLVYQQPAPGDPSDPGVGINAQPGAGFTLSMASTGVFEGNIISGVVLDELGFANAVQTSGIELKLESSANSKGTHYSGGNLIQNNILYRVAGLYANVTTSVMSNSGSQQFVSNYWYDRGGNSNVLASVPALTSFNSRLEVDGNTFFTDRSNIVDGGSSLGSWKNAIFGTNELLPRSEAPWSNPTRSLKTYAQDVLGLTVTSKTGLPEFFEVAANMRKGQWNRAYTAEAVVDYIREGFDLPPVGSGGTFIPVTGVTLNANTLLLNVAATAQLTGTISPLDATNAFMSWSSDAPGIVSVNSSGLVTAVAEGSATITVTTSDGGYTDTCLVTVGSGNGTLWRGEYIIEDEYFAETYDFMGLLYIRHDPWVWSDAMKWFYLPEGDLNAEGSWLWSVH